MEPNYQNIEDFLEDESFVNSVQGTHEADINYWKQWAIEHPDSQALMEEARLVIRGIPFAKVPLAQDEMIPKLELLKKELGILSTKPKVLPFYQKNWLKWAAAISLLLLGGYWINQSMSTPQHITWTTSYGETQEIVLPDGSRIQLNANSTLSYPATHEYVDKKDIRLEGEAYFELKKQTAGNFYSISAGDLTAKVLGTSFNLNTRAAQTVLSLDEGRISLAHKQGDIQEIEGGRVAWYDANIQGIVITESRNRFWNSWTEETWIFDEYVTFEQVLERIEVNYGVKWTVERPELLKRKLEGSASIETLDVLLESLSYVYDIEIVRKGDTELIIK